MGRSKRYVPKFVLLYIMHCEHIQSWYANLRMILYCRQGLWRRQCTVKLQSPKNTLIEAHVCLQLRARIRAEVFQSLEQQGETVTPPSKPEDVYLACELVRELMMSLGLNNSLSVFQHESGQPSEMRIDRPYLASELGFRTNERTDRDVPLLLLVVRMLKEMKMKQIDDIILE